MGTLPPLPYLLCLQRLHKHRALFTVFLYCFFKFLGCPWAPFSTHVPICFLIKKPVSFPIDFADVIFIDSGLPKPPEFSCRIDETRDAQNQKHTFSISEPLWDTCWVLTRMQRHSKM